MLARGFREVRVDGMIFKTRDHVIAMWPFLGNLLTSARAKSPHSQIPVPPRLKFPPRKTRRQTYPPGCLPIRIFGFGSEGKGEHTRLRVSFSAPSPETWLEPSCRAGTASQRGANRESCRRAARAQPGTRGGACGPHRVQARTDHHFQLHPAGQE